ncbi:DEKNAAC101016 [Brettanomyces naardenensis]|uniref:DEKNAAC101017 n=1 Tax=Brettanomyces naardenensis TaxID=13370 RepID=A0A448YGW3_BRENA|nr:DEKNAAC101016 [Brettanomyces naardenensis]
MSSPEQLIAEASKKTKKSSGLLSSFFGSSQESRYEEAADLYVEAANMYKLQRRSAEAGHTFEKAAECQKLANSPDEAANTLVEAYKAYKAEVPIEAAQCLEKAIEMFVKRGQFRRSATFKADLGELYENELHDAKKAIESYEDASEWYKGDSANALANKTALKAADLYCDETIQKYGKAAQVYEQIAKESLNNNLAKWSLKEYFLKAVLCRLADNNDYASANACLNRFLQWDPSFETTREYEFGVKLVDAVKDGDPSGIANASKNYDKFSRLDGTKVRILNKIKSNVVEVPDQVEEDFT